MSDGAAAAGLTRPIEEGLARWLDTCAAADPHALERVPDGQWSVKQHTFHVADGMDATRQRIASMLAEATPDILAFDADEWALQRRYQERSWEQAVQALRQERDRLLAACAKLTAADLARTGRHRRICETIGIDGDTLSIAELLRFEAAHVQEHLVSVQALTGPG